MSTTFVLHGGATSIDSPQNDEFFAKFTSLVDKDEVNILMCYFAQEKSKWQDKFKRDEGKVLANSTKKINFYIPQNTQDLRNKINSFDVLYVYGGPSKMIEGMYSDLSWLKEALDGKVYLGTSMGAFMVSTKYVLSFDDQDVKTVHNGLGILPVNTLVHWNQEQSKEEKIQMLQKESDLPIITLNEGQSVTLIS